VTISPAPAAQVMLRVAELFGPTIQGEGPSTGQRAVFVRLSGCNLDCSWCDTAYTWDWTRFDPTNESHEMTVGAVGDWVLEQDADLVVITGGEPLIQHRRLVLLVEALTARGRRVEIETNGTVLPDIASFGSMFNVSPKLASSGVPAARRIRPDVLSAFRDSGRAVFKFVVDSDADVAELVELQHELRLAPIWVMPQGTTESVVKDGLRRLADSALLHGWNISPRLHVLLWGDERGR
jgi:7-carboxy-7-deazaguanine synthase